MSKRSINIRKYFSSFSVFIIIVLLLIQFFVLFYIFRSNMLLSQQYLKDNVKQIHTNVEKYLYQIENMGYFISTNWSFISLYSDEPFIKNNQAFGNTSQITSFVCGYDSSIVGVCAITPDGTVSNFFGGIFNDIFTDANLTSVFSNTKDFNRAFYFFDNEQEIMRDYFVYYAPIFEVGTQAHTATKVSTLVFICNKTAINRFLEYNQVENASAYSISDHNGMLIASNKSWDNNLSKNPLVKPDYSNLISKYGLYIQGISLSNRVNQNMHHLIMYLGIISAYIFLVLPWLMLSIRNYITRPVNNILTQLANYNSGDLKEHIQNTGIDEIDIVVENINKMIDNIRSITRQTFFMQDKLYESELRKTEAELYALQSQVNPHFLYNTLQCIRGLASLGRKEDVKNISLAMSDVFKYSIEPGEFVQIIEEIKIVYKYLLIHKIRFNNNLEYTIDIPEEILDCKIIKMVIQPVVENTMVHAYKDTDVLPKIYILARVCENDILFRIIDNGNGIDYETLLLINNQMKRSFSDSIKEISPLGQGLYNVHRRIQLNFGEKYGIVNVFSNPNGTEVNVLIPYQKFTD